MSITTSTEEREQAVEKLAAKSDEQLREELAYWSVAVVDHQDAFVKLTNERHAAADLHEEAQAWVRLVTVELQKRRNRRRLA